MTHTFSSERPESLAASSERDILLTLFDLGRQVASVIELDELLPRIPELIALLIPFDAFAAYSYALQHLDIAIVSLYTYVNPVIAVALGTLVLGEAFHLRMLAAAAVIVCGILIVRPARKMPRKETTPVVET